MLLLRKPVKIQADQTLNNPTQELASGEHDVRPNTYLEALPPLNTDVSARPLANPTSNLETW